MSAKLLDLKGYNFYTDEDYHRERELELQELFMKKNVTDKEQQDSLLEHYKRMFPTEYQLRVKLNTEESTRALTARFVKFLKWKKDRSNGFKGWFGVIKKRKGNFQGRIAGEDGKRIHVEQLMPQKL